MGLFSRVELSDLLIAPALPCISIYLPASIYRSHRKGETVRQQFQQAVNLIRQQLTQMNCSNDSFPTAANFLETMRAIQPQAIDALTSESVAIFYAPHFLRWYRLPGCLIEAAKVGKSFDLKPLLSLLLQGELFYILGFGQSQMRLLQGSRQGIRQVSLQELPERLGAVLGHYEPSMRSERLIRSGRARRLPIEDDSLEQEAILKQQMHQSCKQLSDQIDRFSASQNAPLLLAGMPQILSTYRTLNPTLTMLNTDIAGNLDTMKLEELHQQAWNRVQELVSSEREQALRQYQRAAQVGSASNHLGDIITKAISGKVKTLFLSSSYQKWGRFNPYTWEVDVHWRAEAGDIDLTQFAVEQTLLHGGSVYVMHPEMFASPKTGGKSADGTSIADSNDFGTIAAILRS